jgi:hypothetical protein
MIEAVLAEPKLTYKNQHGHNLMRVSHKVSDHHLTSCHDFPPLTLSTSTVGIDKYTNEFVYKTSTKICILSLCHIPESKRNTQS